MKLADIKKFVTEFEFPDEIKLNKGSTIREVAKFFDSHICAMESKLNPKRIKMLHYNRVMKAIEIMKEQGLVRKDGVIEEPVIEVKKDNSLDLPETIGTESAIKPNNDFDSGAPIRPNTGFDDEKPVEYKKPPPEPNRIVEQEAQNKEEPPEFTQGSLF